jgi:adenosine deaminase
MRHLRRAPKIDLHRHLTGSIDAGIAARIGAQYDVALPTYIEGELDRILFKDSKVNSLEEYFLPWKILNRLFISLEATRDLLLEVIRKAADDNVIYLELRVGPHGFLGYDKALPFDKYMELLAQTSVEAEKRFGTITRFILGLPRHTFVRQRNRNKQFSVMTSAILNLRHYFVGVDLNGVEAAAAPKEFKHCFEIAHRRAIPITIHAGECGPAANIESSINELHASRIGHGLAAMSDPAILSLLAVRGCPLEICPTSNQFLGVIHQISDLPVKILRQYGIPFVICTDNPARCKISLTDELFKFAKAFELTPTDIKHLTYAAADHSFADEQTRSALKQQLNKYFESTQVDCAVG